MFCPFLWQQSPSLTTRSHYINSLFWTGTGCMKGGEKKLCWFWVSQMIQTRPDVDPAQLIPAASEDGEQPSPNSLYCSTSWRHRTRNLHSAKQHYDNWCTSTNHRLNRQSDGCECERQIGPSPKNISAGQKHISWPKTNPLAKEHFWSNSQSVLSEKMEGREKDGSFRAGKRNVKDCFCISILIYKSPK